MSIGIDDELPGDRAGGHVPEPFTGYRRLALRQGNQLAVAGPLPASDTGESDVPAGILNYWNMLAKWRWLIAGCLLPDLIDKPLFYGLLWLHGHPDPLISGSRSVGHTGLFLVSLLAIALLSRRAAAWAGARDSTTSFTGGRPCQRSERNAGSDRDPDGVWRRMALGRPGRSGTG